MEKVSFMKSAIHRFRVGLFSPEFIYPFTGPILSLMNFKTISKNRDQVMQPIKKSLRNVDTYDGILSDMTNAYFTAKLVMSICIKVLYHWPWTFSFQGFLLVSIFRQNSHKLIDAELVEENNGSVCGFVKYFLGNIFTFIKIMQGENGPVT